MADSLVYFDPEFEGVMMAALLQRHPAIEVGELRANLQPDLFTVEPYRWLLAQMPETPPTKPQLQQLVHEAYDADQAKREHYLLVLVGLFDLDISDDLTDAMGAFRRYIAFQKASQATVSFHTKFKTSRNVPEALRELQDNIAQATSLLTQNSLKVVDFAADWGRREVDRVYVRDNPELFPQLRLGIPKFDQQVKMKAGTVTNFLAPMKRYKSVILASAAFSGLLQGYNMALVVAENTIDLTLDRLDAMATRLHYERIVHALKTPAEQAYADQLYERMKGWKNRLKVIKGDPYRIGVSDVLNAVAKLERDEGFTPDGYVFDYLNIMRPSVTRDPAGKPMADHDMQTQICWDLQGLAKRPGREAFVVTATQANMAGLEVGKDGKPIKIGAQHQGRSIGIAQAVDATVAINLEVTQTDDSGWQPPQIVLSILYLRNGKVIFPDIKLLSEIDAMCMDIQQRDLWNEIEDGQQPPLLPV